MYFVKQKFLPLYKMGKNIFFLFSLLKKYKQKLFFLMLMPALWSMLEVTLPYFMKSLVDNLTFSRQKDSHILLFFLATVFLMEIIMRVGSLIALKTWPTIRGEIRNFFWNSLLNQPYGSLHPHLVGEVVTLLNSTAHSFEKGLSALLYGFYSVSISFLIACFLMGFIHPYICCLFVGWYVCMLAVTLFFLRKSLSSSKQHAKAENFLMGTVADIFQHMLIVKLFEKEDKEKSYLTELQDREVRNSQKADKYIWYADIVRGCVSIILLGGLVYGIEWGWERGLVTAGEVTFISIVVLTMRRDIWWASLQLLTACREFGSLLEGLEFLQQSSFTPPKAPKRTLCIKQGSIDFHKVSFGYSSIPILQGVTAHIPGGKVTAIIGESGAGKTSLSHLILGLKKPMEGKILIDGQDIETILPESLLQQVSVVPQEPHLLNRSIKENIAYANPKASIEQILRVSKVAQCHDFITSLEKGYDTIVGEHGIKLSAGQRQRIAIARSLLKEAPIFIFDEPTSALDSLTASSLYTSLETFLKGKTALFITHRLGILEKVDHILVFYQGALVGQGTYEEVLRHTPMYRALFPSLPLC